MDMALVFGVIFSVIVIGFVIAFAVPLIMNSGCNQQQLQMSSVLNELKNKVSDVYLLSKDSTIQYTLNIPGSSKICFLDATADNNPTEGWNVDDTRRQMIKDSQYNVWYTDCSGEYGKSIAHLSHETGKSFCMQTGKIWLENIGSSVEVSRA